MVKVTIEELIDACKSFADKISGPVREATESFPYPQNFAELVWRCVLRKSLDYFSTIVELTKSGRPWAALPLLRPMCEDLFYLRYLAKLDPKDADSFIKLSAKQEIIEGLSVQSKGNSSQAWAETGDTSLSPHEIGKKEIDARLKALNGTLGDKGWNKSRAKPSVYEVADSVEHGRSMYKTLYFATSKHVHFSAHQLMRMVGCEDGQTGSVRHNPIFDRLDSAFVTSTAAWLFIFVITACRHQGFVQADGIWVDGKELMVMLKEFGTPPLILPYEYRAGDIDDDPMPRKPAPST